MDVIKYQCTHCNTLYHSTDHCPTCGSLSQNAIQINYTQNIKTRKEELTLDTYFIPVYKFVCILHFITCLSWFGLWLSIPTTVLHLVYIFVIKKKRATDSPNTPLASSKKKALFFQIISILDMVLCVPSVLAMTAMLIYEIFPFY